ncbi:TIGR00180 family glycosyltransferase [Pseudomonas sp. CDFA 602]|uniref:TIGR00180 family glycosyltransferase n=1 Tax=Pseudomonas californiensis TaxID=2829823 RepID=UPI001E62DC21|nr:TIGR00180 family glycosyltransferase [Pseudomonas californiensis]MCD5992984.1 TIGR00180 family glycosyltransferase [Pseudomonas californiensis]MCD5998361.1 TIGR00180 family glycosyltransferase [Pseudomonas californiensis]
MQGKHGSENVLPLNELLTVVLISHNKPAFLRRAVRFYSQLPCKILVLDSSSEATDGLEGVSPFQEYQHLPQYGYWGIQEKLRYGVRQVTTPYMVFAADDDFLLHDALFDSVGFLDANPDYGMCHGYCLMYLTMGKKVQYFRRDKKVQEDYSSDSPEERVVEFMGQFLPPFYAVTRTSLLLNWYEAMPENTSFQWQEIGHAYYMAASAKLRVLPIPYVIREVNVGSSEHKTEVAHSLLFTDKKSVEEREAFADVLAAMPLGMQDLSVEQRRQVVIKGFTAMGDCLLHGRSLATELIFDSTWTIPEDGPERRFGPVQYMEMPYYNQAFFDRLTEIEFFLHAMPAGRMQLMALEGVWVRQEQLMAAHVNDNVETLSTRLWDAMQLNAFNRRVVKALAEQLQIAGEEVDAQNMKAWAHRLESCFEYDSLQTLGTMRSGAVLKWLAARTPTVDEQQLIAKRLEKEEAPQFGLLLLDLEDSFSKVQITLDSLVEGLYKGFKIVVFTTGEPPAATLLENTLHFVKVSKNNYVDKLNQITRQLSSDWVMLAEVGDEFTPAGLLQAGLELMAAPQCRAVYADEIHRLESGSLVEIFRPGFNLDMLQSVPALMARHWLIRRDVLVDAGGYASDFTDALEFDLLLRIIQQGGTGWLAHLDEPLLICDTPTAGNTHERLALSRHLASLGYKAQIASEPAGTYQIDYRHAERPMVSVMLHGDTGLEHLQDCLASVLQRTRYLRFEVLIAAHQGMTSQMLGWIGQQEQSGGRVRVVAIAEGLTPSAARNAMAAQAQGEYLLWLATDSKVVTPNWISSLLNQALRPEVGVVGARLTDSENVITQAGLILGLNGRVGSAFVGVPSELPGYMYRLQIAQNYSAVSASCLMVRKELFESVDGFDEGRLAHAFSDIDLCLKIGQSGFMTVWTPQAQIQHCGVLSDDADALAALQEKWAGQFEHDQAYNRNLSLTGDGFKLGETSSVNWAQLLH